MNSLTQKLVGASIGIPCAVLLLLNGQKAFGQVGANRGITCDKGTPAAAYTLPDALKAGEEKDGSQPGRKGIGGKGEPPPEAPAPEIRGLPINLPTALRLAQTSNLDIAQAREVVNQFMARWQGSRVQVLPSLNFGSAYNYHQGQIQKTEGNIETVNRDSLFVGGGPSVVFSLTDAVFAPLAARQALTATQAGLDRVNNDTLLAVANAYFEVLRAMRRLARVNETLQFLTAERVQANKTEFKGLLPLLKDYVEVGAKEALKSDLARAEVEILRRREEQRAALEDLRVATAELAVLIRLDPATPLGPTEDFRLPVPFPGEEWENQPVEQLIAQALAARPELAENRALVQAALDRYRAARWRPYLPNVLLNYSAGGYGGAPDPLKKGGFGPSGEILHFDWRNDFDAALVWRLQNMGLGNRAEIREQRGLHQQAILHQLQVEDRVVAQVVQAQEQARGWHDRVNITRSALFNADGSFGGPVFRSLQLNFERIKGAPEVGRPLEVLDSIRGLSDTLESYGQAVTDYERARFRLLVTLGIPPQAWFTSEQMTIQRSEAKGQKSEVRDETLRQGGQKLQPPPPIGTPPKKN